MAPPARSSTSRRRRPATAVVTGVRAVEGSPRATRRRFERLLEEGAELRAAGSARRRPRTVLERFPPREELALFDASVFLSSFRHDEAIDFFVAYVGLRDERGRVRRFHPRIFYKDVSLVWRAASHVCFQDGDAWIGKGDVKWERRADGEYEVSAEETTNLPYELQAALDLASRRGGPRRDGEAVRMVLRAGPPDRVRAYADFTGPRERARAAWRVNGGRPVARFVRRHDPTSLRFARGYEPDFRGGVLEVDLSGSRVYGGEVRKFRIASTNDLVQYQFVSTPTHVWVNPPQTFTTELTTYCTRPHEVLADDDAFVPGYEYHFADDPTDPFEHHSQIPPGYAGAPSPDDTHRADASAWIEELPVIREFRRAVLGGGR